MMEFLTLMQQELGLTLIIVLLLLMKLAGKSSSGSVSAIVNVLLLVNLALGFVLHKEGTLFDGMYTTGKLLILEKCILTFGTILISMQSSLWLKDHQHVPEFYMLLLSTLMGMFYMISSGNILMFYLALELSTIPLAALCNFDLERRRSSEAAMKLILSSAFSSGIFLFGVSLLYGTTGSLKFSEIAIHLTGSELQIMAFILLFAGFAFKISVVPFHLWTADVYEGSPVAITSYLSVISKGAIVFAFVQVLYNVFQPMLFSWYNALFIASVLTMTIGNLFALRQANIKRFLAFSSITQAGYILLGISGNSHQGTASVVYFVLVYIFSNLGAFGVVSLVSSVTGKEEIGDYKGFQKTNPMLAWVMALSLFSLAGIPPTAGFFGKLFLFTAGAAKQNYIFLTIAGLNMIVSLYYYLKVVRAMFVDTSDAPIEKISGPLSARAALAICVAGVLLAGLFGQIYEYIFSLSSGS